MTVRGDSPRSLGYNSAPQAARLLPPAMADHILIQVEGLTRYYGAACAVHGLGFTLYRGQVLGFLGPNGAGKSTTMQMLAGCLAPSAGRILIDGVDLLEEPQRAKAALGYLPEQPPLYRELTVDEYLTYCARLHNLPRAAAAAAVRQAKARCGLEEVGRRLLGSLSRGYQQRAGIAQAILHAPAVVILDEPTVGLDPIQIRQIRTLIQELGREHGVILSTHSLSEVQAVCSHVQIIHRGRLVYASPLAELARPSLVVGLSAPPALEQLAGLSEVSAVDRLAEGRFRLHHRPGADPVAGLVERACTQGWGLRELTPERPSLEQVFIDLTLGGAEAARWP